MNVTALEYEKMRVERDDLRVRVEALERSRSTAFAALETIRNNSASMDPMAISRVAMMGMREAPR